MTVTDIVVLCYAVATVINWLDYRMRRLGPFVPPPPRPLFIAVVASATLSALAAGLLGWVPRDLFLWIMMPCFTGEQLLAIVQRSRPVAIADPDTRAGDRPQPHA